MKKQSEPTFVLTTLAGLLQLIRHHLFNKLRRTKSAKARMQCLGACVNHLSHFLKKVPSDISIDSILTIEVKFARRLRRLSLASTTIRKNVSSLRALIRYAKRFGYKHPHFLLADKWSAIPAKARIKGIPSLIKYAIENNIAPIHFTRCDLDNWCRLRRAAGVLPQEVERQRKHFSYAIKKLRLLRLFRKFEAEQTRLPMYALPLSRMPARLRADVLAVIRWAQREQWAKRLRGRCTLPLQRNLESLCGYAINVRGMRKITRIQQLLTKSSFRSYTWWLSETRGCSRRAIVNALSALHSVVLRHEKFDSLDFGWWKEILDEIEPEPQSQIDERRRNSQIRFEELAAIPDQIRNDRLRAKNCSPKDIALLARDELIMRFLVKAVMLPFCVRTATLSNIQKLPVPIDDPSFTVSDRTAQMLESNRNLLIWQFTFSPMQTPRGKAVRGPLLCEIVAPLEEYLKSFRPILLGEGDSDCLFIRDTGGAPLSGADLTTLVKSLTRRYAGGVGVTPSSIKMSFVEYWIEKYPDGSGYVDLANILWMDYVSVRMAYDPTFRRSFAGKAAD